MTVSNNTSISSNQPPMSVTYAFMKKANINPIIPSNINTTTTNSTTQTNVNFNNGTYQPKFLLTNNHQSYPTFINVSAMLVNAIAILVAFIPTGKYIYIYSIF